jgi:hypothetical protein
MVLSHPIITKRKFFRLAMALLGLTLILAMSFYLIRHVPGCWVYNLRATYRQMPPDDDKLTRWLDMQPGVEADSVNIQRQGETVFASFVMTRDLSGNPTMPEFERACDSLGYRPWTDWLENWKDPTEIHNRPRGHEFRSGNPPK